MSGYIYREKKRHNMKLKSHFLRPSCNYKTHVDKIREGGEGVWRVDDMDNKGLRLVSRFEASAVMLAELETFVNFQVKKFGEAIDMIDEV